MRTVGAHHPSDTIRPPKDQDFAVEKRFSPELTSFNLFGETDGEPGLTEQAVFPFPRQRFTQTLTWVCVREFGTGTGDGVDRCGNCRGSVFHMASGHRCLDLYEVLGLSPKPTQS